MNPAGRASCPARPRLERQPGAYAPPRSFTTASGFFLSALFSCVVLLACGGVTNPDTRNADLPWASESISDDGPVYWSGVVGQTVVQVSRKTPKDSEPAATLLQLVGRDIQTGEVSWRQQLAMNGDAWTTCLASDDALILTGGLRVASLNADRGTFNWIRDMRSGSVQQADVQDGWIWVQSTTGDLLNLSTSGDKGNQWTQPPGQFWVSYGIHDHRPMAVTSNASWLDSSTALSLWDLSGSDPRHVWTRDMAPSTMAVQLGNTHVLTYQSDSYSTGYVRAFSYDSESSADDNAFPLPGTCSSTREGVTCSETFTESSLTFVTIRLYNGGSTGPAWTRTLLAPGGWCESRQSSGVGPLTWRCQNLVYALRADTGDVVWSTDLTQSDRALDLCGAVGETDRHAVFSCTGTNGVELVGLRTNNASSWGQRMVIP